MARPKGLRQLNEDKGLAWQITLSLFHLEQASLLLVILE
jgi:hypothetical protein